MKVMDDLTHHQYQLLPVVLHLLLIGNIVDPTTPSVVNIGVILKVWIKKMQ
jgi:hypothetical protein